jgi:uncharacterized protein
MSSWLAVALAVGFGAAVKAISGMGLPPVAIPALAAFVGVEDAIVIMAIPTVVTNLALILDGWETRRRYEDLPRMLVAAAVGGAAGAWLFSGLEPSIVAVLLSVVVTVYVVSRLVQRQWSLQHRTAARLAVPVGLVGGVSQGATGLSGSVFATYLHAASLPPAVFVFSIAALFQLSSTFQVVGLAVLGRYDARLFGLSVLAATLALTVMFIVRPFARRVPRAAFDHIVLVIIAASTVQMLVDSFR